MPGENNSLQQFHNMLIGGRSRNDLISIHVGLINGAKDVPGIENRKSSRSKYGTKKQKK